MPPLPINNEPSPPTEANVNAAVNSGNIQGSISNVAVPFPRVGLPPPAPTPVPQPTQAPVQPVAAPVTQSTPVATQPIQSVSTAQSGPNVPPGLDPRAYTLTKAIAMQEGGGQILPWTAASGDSGALPTATTGQGGGTYQFTPATWAADAGQVLGDPNAPMTAENQNQVAYTKIKGWLDAGYTPAQAASMWNAGPGSPNSWQPGTVQKVGNTPQYVANVQKYAEQLWNGATPTPTTPQAASSQSPSIGGFLSNVIGSGASFLGNLGNAVMHPINTVENLAAIPVGALQQLGGETTPNTAIFDQVMNTYGQRYGSLSDIAHTLYTDPVGFLADLSTVAGGAAGVAGIAGKLADVANLGDLATAGDAANAAGIDHIVNAAGDVMPTVAPVDASGAAGAAQSVQAALSNISHLSNPLAPVVSGGMALATKGEGLVAKIADQFLGLSANTVHTIQDLPQDFTPEQMATVSRVGLAQEVQGAYKAQLSALDQLGPEYNAIKSDTTMIKVSPTFLENQFRTAAKVDVVDGQIVANGDSVIRNASDINKMQTEFNKWKPYFQSGEMTPNQFLNFREDMNVNMAKFEGTSLKSEKLSGVGKQIYHAANAEYRPQVPGLDTVDAAYHNQKVLLRDTGKGLFDKQGNFTSSAITKIANAANSGKDPEMLANLEKLFPGITSRIRVLHAVEELQSLQGPKVGTYGRSIFGAVRLGGYAYGVATGNLRVVAGAVAMEAIQDPATAVKLIKAVSSVKPELLKPILANMTRYVVMGASTLNASSQQPTASIEAQTANPTAQPVETSPAPAQLPSSSHDGSGSISAQTNTQNLTAQPQDSSPYSSLFSLASSKGITQQQVTDAINGGYSEAQVQQYLSSLK